METIKRLENFIREKDIEAEHMLRTGFWLREIYPEAEEAFYIAAICHDIERCFPLREDEVKPPKSLNDKDNAEYLDWHGRRSAEFAEKLLREYGFGDEATIARIKKLIAEHSVGGTPERDLMMDADSLSFFENNAEAFIRKAEDKDTMAEKFRSEFARIKNAKARELARPLFEQAMRELM